MNTTSPTLLERLRQPNAAAAWTRFVQLYTPLLYYWARQNELQQEDAADLVQEVFLVLLQKLPEFAYDGQRSFRAWLRTVTVNKLRDRRKRRSPDLLGSGLGELAEAVPLDGIALFEEEEYRRHLTARALELARTEFAEKTWRACWEHIVAGRPAPEVATELGMTPGAVYAACFRVLGRLRQELAGLLD